MLKDRLTNKPPTPAALAPEPEARLRNLDMGALRAIVALAERGSLAQAGRALGRTQAALSLQMRKLEQQAGGSLFCRDGRKLELTEAGESMLSYARRILALNDEVQLALRRTKLCGPVRFGASQDFGESWLPSLLAQFRQEFRSVGLEVRVDGGLRLLAALDEGKVDAALALGLGDRSGAVCVGHLPLVWIAHRDFVWDQRSSLPLAVFTAPCRFRSRATAALDASGIDWNVVLTSPSLYGVWAAVSARLGITVRTPEGLLPDLEIVDRKFGLPNLGSVDVSLFLGDRRSPALDSLVELVRDRLHCRIRELQPRIPHELLLADRRAVIAGSAGG
jgi:DNA-binding transcriptional LysR family regulator